MNEAAVTKWFADLNNRTGPGAANRVMSILARLIRNTGKNQRTMPFLQWFMCRFAVAKNATDQCAETLADDRLCSEWLNLVNNPD